MRLLFLHCHSLKHNDDNLNFDQIENRSIHLDSFICGTRTEHTHKNGITNWFRVIISLVYARLSDVYRTNDFTCHLDDDYDDDDDEDHDHLVHLIFSCSSKQDQMDVYLCYIHKWMAIVDDPSGLSIVANNMFSPKSKKKNNEQ